MSNMSYCRFQNTLRDLEDCYDHLWDQDLISDEEEKAKTKLIEICHMISDDCEKE